MCRRGSASQASSARPDAQIVDGYQPGITTAAVAGLNLSADDVQALVAFIEAQR